MCIRDRIKNVDNVKKVLGDAFVEGMSVVDVQDVVVDGNATFPLTITFKVPGVVSGTKVAVLHYNTCLLYTSEPKKYILLSAHSEENIDTEKNFISLFTAINKLVEKYDMPILYLSLIHI